MSADSPRQRSLIASVAAESLHARVTDPTAHTAPARAAGPGESAYWEARVDPDGILAPEQRARQVEHAKKAHYKRLALRSLQVRRRARAPAPNMWCGSRPQQPGPPPR
jgi:hypothetical protein